MRDLGRPVTTKDEGRYSALDCPLQSHPRRPRSATRTKSITTTRRSRFLFCFPWRGTRRRPRRVGAPLSPPPTLLSRPVRRPSPSTQSLPFCSLLSHPPPFAVAALDSLTLLSSLRPPHGLGPEVFVRSTIYNICKRQARTTTVFDF